MDQNLFVNGLVVVSLFSESIPAIPELATQPKVTHRNQNWGVLGAVAAETV